MDKSVTFKIAINSKFDDRPLAFFFLLMAGLKGSVFGLPQNVELLHVEQSHIKKKKYLLRYDCVDLEKIFYHHSLFTLIEGYEGFEFSDKQLDKKFEKYSESQLQKKN